MPKIKVCLHSENLSSGALIHSVKNIAKYINKDEFEVFLSAADKTCYGPEVIKYFDKENILIYPREPGSYYEWDESIKAFGRALPKHPIYDFLKEKEIDIIQDQRGGGSQFPLNSPWITCKKIEHNVFGGFQTYDKLNKTMCISQGVYNDWMNQCMRIDPSRASLAEVVAPLIDYPNSKNDLRNELGINKNTIVIGRSSNAWAGDSLNIEVFGSIEKILGNKVLFISPDHIDQRGTATKLNIKNIIFIPPITSYERMSMFYNTMDIMAHDRGESFGASIAESMMHNTPVVTKGWSNNPPTPSTAQEELVPKEFCAKGITKEEVFNDYRNIILKLCQGGREYCREEGKKMLDRVEKRIAAPIVVKRVEQIYKEVLNAS